MISALRPPPSSMTPPTTAIFRDVASVSTLASFASGVSPGSRRVSKCKANLDLIRARLNKMRPAERRQKVVQRFFVRDVDNGELQLDSIPSACHEQIVRADCDVE